MIKKYLFLIFTLSLGIISGCKKSTSSTQGVSVLTQHNNNTRSGWNNHETLLTTSNVNVNQFGKQFSLPVDDQIFAQPLVVGHLHIDNGVHNVVYIATVNNTVYAYDGDTGRMYWKKNFTQPGMRPFKNTDMTGACGGHYEDFTGNIGIVGTPVIDKASNTIYFVTRSTTGSTFVQHLHAVNIVNGHEKSGSPVKISATYKGTGAGSQGNTITFNAQHENQRQGLTLVNGMVYMTFSSYCDWGPFHGWILGYDATTLNQQIVYNDTPNGYDGGLWESGMGMAADAQGNLYDVAGNGTVGVNGNPTSMDNRGESAVKLSQSGSSLKVNSYFTPYSYKELNQKDLDYGSLGALLIPNSNDFLTGGKDGNLYLLNKNQMGGYQSSSNNIRETIAIDSSAYLHSQPAYFKGKSKGYVYIWSENANLSAYSYDSTSERLNKNPITSTVKGPTGYNGAVLSVSSNGSKNNTGILWASYAWNCNANHKVCPGILRAFDASDITKQLWNNHQNYSRDGAGNYAKFSAPTVADGHVYLPTFSDKVVVYGLLK